MNYNTHANKANSYDLGRPDYPSDFFSYLYNEIGFNKNDTSMGYIDEPS